MGFSHSQPGAPGGGGLPGEPGAGMEPGARNRVPAAGTCRGRLAKPGATVRAWHESCTVTVR